jgi:hypothetical protein
MVDLLTQKIYPIINVSSRPKAQRIQYSADLANQQEIYMFGGLDM